MIETTHLVISDITKRFGKKEVLKGINLHIEKGEYIVILGPTGAGKTTLLKIIAGLLPPTSGIISTDAGEITRLPPESRNLAYLPQTSDYSLFAYMNVWNNAIFSLRMKDEKTLPEITAIGNEVLDLVNLRHRYNALPHELSGGMKQRVALARAIATDAGIFLLDEPLRALDARLRIILRTELKKLVTDLKKTTFHVTHDQEEALAVADRILIINEGSIIQFGTPQEIYQRPKTLFSAYFFGITNLIPVSFKEINNDKIIFSVGKHTITSLVSSGGMSETSDVIEEEYVLAIKADTITVTPISSTVEIGINEFIGTIKDTHYLGKWVHLIIEVDSFPKQVVIAIPSTDMKKYDLNTDVIIKFGLEDIIHYNEPWIRVKQLEDS
ncbi:MAG: ABC transporter ATP-binding protein [Candidatus Hodarchaeales archaeon]|jgi:ABC-type Fe3+/spermidine/putrescine transport system ATPase subunit